VLRGGTLLYQFGVGLRNQAYERGWIRQVRLACPVISVGNLAVGGTGKTTCVEYLTNKLTRLGKRVCILSRGYGGRGGQPYWLTSRDRQLLINGQPTTALDGLADEPQLLSLHLPDVPIVVGARREQTGKRACDEFQADVVILDDGFQYRRLARDCEIVLVNARMPLGGWSLLPRGPMREPLISLRRADVLIITKADQSLDQLAALQERLRMFNPSALMATAVHEPTQLWDGISQELVSLDRLANGRVSLLSSIGDPEGFEDTVRRLGATVVSHMAYPDHHRYRPSDWQDVLDVASRAGAEALVTTEKDWIRLQRLTAHGSRLTVPIWVLRVQMRLLSGEDLLDDRLTRLRAR
jgi:tetraacyldisaccharide 4'-kinase